MRRSDNFYMCNEENMCPMCPVSNIRKEKEFHTFFAGFMKNFVDICPEFKLWDLRNMCLDKYYDKEHFQRLSFGPLGK